MRVPRPPWALLRARLPGRRRRAWFAFEGSRRTFVARELSEVRGVIAAAQQAAAEGRWAVGFIAYEAAAALDSALVTRPAGSLPLAWFAVFDRIVERLVPAPPDRATEPDVHWRPTMTRPAYEDAIGRIRELIAAGDTYQVNFTWRLEAEPFLEAWTFFHHLVGVAPPDHAAFLDTGRHAIASASPELFFRLEEGRLTCRPMKGTIGRGRWLEEDRRQALELFDSPKNRAENLMIVDMVRNDLSRVAETGSVRVESLFDLEQHDTVFQLTSTVTASTRAAPGEILDALFPCASVTGAPKVRTMEIIAELENRPRGVYTGALGYLAPAGHAEMSVAIRTACIDRERGTAEYGTGGGIVWDSEAGNEYEECLAKTRILRPRRSDFSLLETILWTASDGYRLLDRHLERLVRSADYFGFRIVRRRVMGELQRLGAGLKREGKTARVVRLTAGRRGRLALTTRPAPGPERRWRLSLAAEPIDPENRFLFHKTTQREFYDRARAGAPDADDVLLWNPAGELTETTWANLAVLRDGRWRTPPVTAGLLAGCERQERLDRGDLIEDRLTLADLAGARDVAVMNSVRGWIPVAGLTDPRTGRRLWPASKPEEPAARSD